MIKQSLRFADLRSETTNENGPELQGVRCTNCHRSSPNSKNVINVLEIRRDCRKSCVNWTFCSQIDSGQWESKMPQQSLEHHLGCDQSCRTERDRFEHRRRSHQHQQLVQFKLQAPDQLRPLLDLKCQPPVCVFARPECEGKFRNFS